MPPSGYNGLAVEAISTFVAQNMRALIGEVKYGKHRDLRVAVEAEAVHLRRSREWVAEQMNTTEGYAALVAQGFAEILIADAVNGVMLAFYERLLHISDPEAEKPTDINVAWVRLCHYVGFVLHNMRVDDDSSVSGLQNASSNSFACSVCGGKLLTDMGQSRAEKGKWSGWFQVLRCATCGTVHSHHSEMGLQVLPASRVRLKKK